MNHVFPYSTVELWQQMRESSLPRNMVWSSWRPQQRQHITSKRWEISSRKFLEKGDQELHNQVFVMELKSSRQCTCRVVKNFYAHSFRAHCFSTDLVHEINIVSTIIILRTIYSHCWEPGCNCKPAFVPVLSIFSAYSLWDHQCICHSCAGLHQHCTQDLWEDWARSIWCDQWGEALSHFIQHYVQ